jgi:hypothetical protein
MVFGGAPAEDSGSGSHVVQQDNHASHLPGDEQDDCWAVGPPPQQQCVQTVEDEERAQACKREALYRTFDGVGM